MVFILYNVESVVSAAGLLSLLERVIIVATITLLGGCYIFSRIDKRIDQGSQSAVPITLYYREYVCIADIFCLFFHFI